MSERTVYARGVKSREPRTHNSARDYRLEAREHLSATASLPPRDRHRDYRLEAQERVSCLRVLSCGPA